MHFAARVPGAPLDRYVERLWFYEGLDVDHARERVLPSGTFELIVNLRDTERCLFRNDDLTTSCAFRRVWVSGAQTGYLVIDAPRNASLVGARFRPGGAAAVLGVSARDLTDRVVELDEIWGREATALWERLREASSPQDTLATLERALGQRLRTDRRRERERCVAHAVACLARDPSVPRLDRIAAELDWSHKHLIECFRHEVGLTPKRLCRVLRFQRVLLEIERRRALDWASLAVDCGYYDQSHFIHEFRGFSGLNPSTYLRERGDYLGHVPLRDPSGKQARERRR